MIVFKNAGGRLAAVLVVSLSLGAPASAWQAAPAASAEVKASDALNRRAAEFSDLVNGTKEPAQLFAPQFLARVSADQIKQRWVMARERFGPLVKVGKVQAESANVGTFPIQFEKGEIDVKLSVQADAPNLIEMAVLRPK